MEPGVILGVSALGLDPQDDSLLYAATGYWLGTSDRCTSAQWRS